MGLRTFFRGDKKSDVMVPKIKEISNEEVRSLFELWNDALQTGSSSIVAKRYSSDPILLPTVSDVPRTDFASIKDYFDNFLKKKPSGRIIEGKITKGINWCQDAGIYEFTMGIDGSKVMGRYTFVYVYENGGWRIGHHHSSVMPEGISIATPITKDRVRNLFNLWNDALATLDSTEVANRYSKEPVLLPTVSDTPRTDHALIKDYFDAFLLKQPQGEILSGDIIIGTNWAQDAGIYEFTMGVDGSKVKGRYTFVYVLEDGQWKISHHHSSVMPEGIVKATPITKDEVRDLFQLWNGALATLDSSKVADRYSKEPVLLPTVSDTPRTDYALIKDYFDAFLLKKPQGEILSGDIIIGTNWAQDAGVYEFTMGVDGSKVKGRYSFIYIFEDGEWKISHHHSSVMPEGIVMPTPITKDEVRDLFQLWNGALDTLDSRKVADRYSKEAVLLPTVSDTPRTTDALIKDYFDGFCQKKPQGEILSGDIIIGANWAQDAGIYEFTMGVDGSKVKGRYSFIYVYEDGEWKISHHHSSVMPEPYLAAMAATTK